MHAPPITTYRIHIISFPVCVSTDVINNFNTFHQFQARCSATFNCSSMFNVDFNVRAIGFGLKYLHNTFPLNPEHLNEFMAMKLSFHKFALIEFFCDIRNPECSMLLAIRSSWCGLYSSNLCSIKVRTYCHV